MDIKKFKNFKGLKYKNGDGVWYEKLSTYCDVIDGHIKGDVNVYDIKTSDGKEFKNIPEEDLSFDF